MTVGRIVLMLLAGAITGFLTAFAAVPAQADPDQFYTLDNQYDTFRPPWREREAWYIDDGKGVGEHTSGANENRYYAVDLNRPGDDCDAPLRAVRSGALISYTEAQTGGQQGYGNLVGILHTGGKSSWYAHLSYNSFPPSAGHVAQGDLVALVDNTGSSSGCHLHFQVHDNQNPPHTADRYTTLEICMSGSCPGSGGFNLQHLTNQRWTAHPSDNTGAGYGRPGAPPLQDPGWSTAPLSTSISALAKGLVALGSEISPFASIQGPCAANRNWVKSCQFGYGGTGYTQNFLTPWYFVSYPYSITVGQGGAYLVQDAFWKAYGRDCGGLFVYQLIGRPTGNNTGSTQYFDFGRMYRDDSNPDSVYVAVYNSDNDLLCSFSGLRNYYTGPCYDVKGDGGVFIGDISAVVDRFGHDESRGDWDDRYDVDRTGGISVADISAVVGQFGQTCS